MLINCSELPASGSQSAATVLSNARAAVSGALVDVSDASLQQARERAIDYYGELRGQMAELAIAGAESAGRAALNTAMVFTRDYILGFNNRVGSTDLIFEDQ